MDWFVSSEMSACIHAVVKHANHEGTIVKRHIEDDVRTVFKAT